MGVSGHLEICDNVHVQGQSRISGTITEAGSYTSGTRLEPTRKWARNAVRFSQLEAMNRRVAELEQRLQSLLEAAPDGDN